MNEFSFSVPQNITVGKGSLAKLPEVAKKLGGSHAFLMSGPHLAKMGLVEKAAESLKSAGIEVDTFTEIEGNPSVETVEKATVAFKEAGADFIVAFGGGSPMDVAKAVGVTAKYGGSITEYEGAHKVPGPIIPLIAIPTTAGTGSEVTAFSVITDYAKGIKYPLADFNITPDIAIVDPALVATLPPHLVAHTGMDALTHAIEAYVSTLNSPFTDPLAIKAIQMVNEHLIKSFSGDMSSREEMHYAQCLAGEAFSNALLGIVHSLAHKTGAAFSTGHIPHGEANAIYLPYVIKYNAKNAEARYADIARSIGIDGTDAECVTKLCDKIDAMNAELNIPKTLKEFGIKEDEFKEKVNKIAELAVGDACTGSNPRPVDTESMAKILDAIYYGKEIDF